MHTMSNIARSPGRNQPPSLSRRGLGPGRKHAQHSYGFVGSERKYLKESIVIIQSLNIGLPKRELFHGKTFMTGMIRSC